MRKKLLLLFLTIVSVACLAFGVTACGGNSGSSVNGTYYLYKNGSYDYTSYITLSGSSWEDDDGESGTYKISGTSITFYYELLGETEELMDGTISDGVMTLNIMGATYTYCLEGKTPSSSGTDEGGSSTTYTVTYNANGGTFADGSVTYTQTVNSGSTLTAPASPTRDGCTFAGWATSKNGSTMWSFSSDKVTADITLYASWTEKSAAILSVDNATIDGSDILLVVSSSTESVSLSSIVVCSSDSSWKLYYDKLGQTEIPTKIAASLTGELNSGDNVFYIVVTSSDGTQVNLYTLTVHRSYAVNVLYYNGSSLLKTEIAYTGYTFDADYEPSITGYTFNYWKTTSSGSTKYTAATLWGNLSLYASTTAKTYTVTYDVSGGNELTETTATVTYDSSYTLTVPTRTNYTFNGWYSGNTQLTNSNGKSLSVWNYTSDKTLTAKWSPNNYTVMLGRSDSSAGTVSGGGSHSYTSSVTITATTNEGYTWIGWYDGNDGLVTTELSYTFIMPAEQVNYNAKWTYYTLTTNVDDSDAGYVTEYSETKITAGNTVTVTATTNSGYTFIGWYNADDELITAELSYTFEMPVENLSITAKWSKVTVIANNSDYGTVTTLTNTYLPGDEVTITATTNSGYTWVGWYDENDELVTTEFSYTFEMPADNLTYTAKWSKVTVIANNSDYGTVTTLTNTYLPGDEVTITATTNSGYTWVGWYDENDELVTTEFSYTFEMPADNLTYTAKWSRVTLTTNYSEAGSITSLTETYTVSDTVKVAASEPNLGYYWIGWYVGDILYTTEYNFDYTMTEDDITYTAKYGINSEMANFTFTSTTTTCEITGIIDNTAKEIVIPDYVTSIGSYVFYNCASLTSVIIGSGVSSLSRGLFYGCSSLVSITLPFVGSSASATSASASTLFGYIFGTSSYDGSEATKQYYAYKSYIIYYIPTTLTTVTITGGNILYGAFSDCTSLTGVTISNEITSIETSAFTGCTSIESIYYNGTASEWAFISFTNDWISTFYSLYLDNELATDIDIEGITTINAYAFANCTSITSVKIGNSIVNIGNCAFRNCDSLESVTIGSGVTSIGAYAFYECTSLTSATFANTSGWSAYSSTLSLTVNIDRSYLENTSSAATCLVAEYSDGGYCIYRNGSTIYYLIWTRSDD